MVQAQKPEVKLARYALHAMIHRRSREEKTDCRVRIGPIPTVEELEAARAKLAKARVNTMPGKAVAVPPR